MPLAEGLGTIGSAVLRFVVSDEKEEPASSGALSTGEALGTVCTHQLPERQAKRLSSTEMIAPKDALDKYSNARTSPNPHMFMWDFLLRHVHILFMHVSVWMHAYVHVSICARVCVLRPRVWLEIAISTGQGRVEAILDLTSAEVKLLLHDSRFCAWPLSSPGGQHEQR